MSKIGQNLIEAAQEALAHSEGKLVLRSSRLNASAVRNINNETQRGNQMPIISHFYGILIYIDKEENSRHKIPHILARYYEYNCVYNFEGEVIEGNLPKKQNMLVKAWCLLHTNELNAVWRAWNESDEAIKLEGLR